MPTRTDPVNGTSADTAGVSCVNAGDIFCNSTHRNYNQVSSSMEEKRNMSTNSTQQTTGLYSVSDEPSTPHRIHSRKHSNRDEVLTQDDIIYKISRSQSAYVRSSPRGSASGADTSRLFNMNARNSKTGLPKRRTVRPKTALGFRERAKSLGNTYPGRSESRNSLMSSSPPIPMSLDPSIPITSNWSQTGIKHLDEEKIQDLYRRYLGREYRVQLIKDDGEEGDEEDGEEGEELNTNNNEDKSSRHDSNVTVDIPQGWVADKTTHNKENTTEMSTPTTQQHLSPSRRQSIDFSTINQVLGVEKAKKPLLKFRKARLQAEAAPRIEVETPQGTIQFPKLSRREGRRRSSAPTLKVACSVEFETAFKGLNVS